MIREIRGLFFEMKNIIDIALKDLTQLLRDRKTFLFTLIMPAIFTLLMGYAFGGFGGQGDSRLPVGWLDLDNSTLSRELFNSLLTSKVIRLVADSTQSPAGLEARVSNEELAGAIVVPADFGHHLKEGKPVKLGLIANTGTTAGTSVEGEALAGMIHLESAVRTAVILDERAGAPFDYTFRQAFSKWQDPPVQVIEETSQAITNNNDAQKTMAQVAPGMMMQFSIAGLLVSAQIIVNERKTRCLQRMLTTRARRITILLGHFLAIFTLTTGQFALLVAYGQFLLGVAYLRSPAAAGLVALAAATCIAGLGLLIGSLARNEEQAVIFSLVPMFLLSGLGGAWVPLEVAGPTFQVVGHFSPVAWALDGFQNVAIRGWGLQSVLLPAGVLIMYAIGFLLLAAWRFQRMQES